jgi:hypothetical protein
MRETRESFDGNNGPAVSEHGRLVPKLLERPFARLAVAFDPAAP